MGIAVLVRMLAVATAAVLASVGAAPARADWNGDGHADVLAVDSGGRLLMYRGNGAGGWATGSGEPIGSGWGSFTALLAPGDFSGDGRPDLLARTSDGTLRLYRGNGASGWITGAGETIGSGWNALSLLTLVGGSPPGPATGPPAPPSVPLPDGSAGLTGAPGCTPPGGRLRVSVRIRHRAGRRSPRVRRVVFFVRGGPRRSDHRAPYVVHLRLDRPGGERGRVYARVYFRRAGSHRTRHKTVSRRFVMC